MKIELKPQAFELLATRAKEFETARKAWLDLVGLMAIQADAVDFNPNDIAIMKDENGVSFLVLTSKGENG